MNRSSPDEGFQPHQGTVSAEKAKDHALSEFEKFRIKQDRQYVSDFDALVGTDSLIADVQKATKVPG